MEIAHLSAQPRRRAPRFQAVGLPARRLRVVVEARSEAERARLLTQLEQVPLASPFELTTAEAFDVSPPLVRISAQDELGHDLELRAESNGSAAASTLVFELVQSLAHAAFGVHVTFSEKSRKSPQRRHAASQKSHR